MISVKFVMTLLCGFVVMTSCYSQKVGDYKYQWKGNRVKIIELMPKASSQELPNLTLNSEIDPLDDRLTMTEYNVDVFVPYPPISFISPTINQKGIRGKSMEVAWTGSMDNVKYSLALYKKGEWVKTIKRDISTNKFSWKIPEKAKPGDDYNLLIESVENPSLMVF